VSAGRGIEGLSGLVLFAEASAGVDGALGAGVLVGGDPASGKGCDGCGSVGRSGGEGGVVMPLT